MRRYQLFSLVAAAVTCCGLAAGATSATASPHLAGAAGSAAAPAASAATTGTWGTAQPVSIPGTATSGASSFVESTSCASAGNCAAVGFYTDSASHSQGFVANETGGTWAAGEEVPGLGALNTGNSATVLSVSCGSAGNCAAGGEYTESPSGNLQAFVVNETNGIWGTAEEVPNSATLNADGDALVTSVSCTPTGTCSAGGTYEDSGGLSQAFVVNFSGTSWGNAEEVPNTATLNTGGGGEVNSVSCPATGTCAAGGSYVGASGLEAFVVNQNSDGTWGNAEEVPNIGTLNTGGSATVDSLSCTPTTCAAGGFYTSSAGQQAFVVDQPSGSGWTNAQEVPGTAAANTGNNAKVASVSCGAAGDCAAVGSYEDVGNNTHAFVANETSSGNWTTEQEIPGTASLNTGGNAAATSVSCPAAGTCAAVGSYKGVTGTQPFVADETSGIWGSAEQAPGSGTLNTQGNGSFLSVSCAAAASCAAGGSITNSTGTVPIVDDETPQAASSTALYAPVSPVRVLDTRNGTGGFSSPVGAGKSIALQITGKNGVPATGVTAVVLNVTATGGTANSFVTAYPDGTTRPAEGSNLNFTKGETIPNLVTVPVGSDGKVDLFNNAGSVNLVADLQGYYTTSGGSGLATAGPVRVLDTRNGTGGFSSPVGAGKSIALQITGSNGVPASGVTAVILNVTATGGTASSFVTAYPDGTTRPAQGSNLNFTKGETIPNLVIVPVGSDGKVDLYNNAGSVNLVADLFGYFVS